MPLEKSIAIVLTGLSLAAYGAEPTNKMPPNRSAQPDVKFLEYLGSLEGDDENWTDIAKSVALKSASTDIPSSTRELPQPSQVQAEAAAKRAESKR